MHDTTFKAKIESRSTNRVLKFLIEANGSILSYNNVLDYWIGNKAFRTFFINLLKASAPAWYVWETPPITQESVERPFEFVLVTIPPRPRQPDQATFATYFDINGGDHGVVTFENLGRDALLIAPSPYTNDDEYTELTNFLNTAPDNQVHALWRVLGNCVRERLGKRPVWVSVAGGGVAWLHMRIDSWPKYYRYGPYRSETM